MKYLDRLTQADSDEQRALRRLADELIQKGDDARHNLTEAAQRRFRVPIRWLRRVRFALQRTVDGGEHWTAVRMPGL